MDKSALAVLAEKRPIVFYASGMAPVQGDIMKTDDNYIMVSMHTPNKKTTLNDPAQFASFTASVPDEQCIYRFETALLRSADYPQRIWYMKVPKDIMRMQRRCHVRVPADLPIRVSVRLGRNLYDKPVETSIINISGGGVRFAFKCRIPVGFEAHVVLPDFPEIGTWETDVLVKSCRKVVYGFDPVYHIGAEFSSELTRHEQDLLIRGIFHLQREQLKKGLQASA